MKKILLNISLIALILTFVLGCNTINQVKKVAEDSKKPKVVNSSDGVTQVTVPGHWTSDLKFNDISSIQTGNLRLEQYLSVISESKADYSDDATLNDYLDLIYEVIKDGVEKPNLSEIKNIKIGEFEAKQFTVSGEVDKLKITYIYTLINGKNHFHQITAWTLTSMFEKNRNVLLETINTFKETGEDKPIIAAPSP